MQLLLSRFFLLFVDVGIFMITGVCLITKISFLVLLKNKNKLVKVILFALIKF